MNEQTTKDGKLIKGRIDLWKEETFFEKSKIAGGIDWDIVYIKGDLIINEIHVKNYKTSEIIDIFIKNGIRYAETRNSLYILGKKL